MGVIDNSKQREKKKTYKLATASLITPVLMWDIGWLFAGIFILIPSVGDWLSTKVILGFLWFFLSAILILLSSPIGIILGILSLTIIKNSGGKLGGKRIAIEAIILSVVLFVLSALLGKVFLMLTLYWKELGVR